MRDKIDLVIVGESLIASVLAHEMLRRGFNRFKWLLPKKNDQKPRKWMLPVMEKLPWDNYSRYLQVCSEKEAAGLQTYADGAFRYMLDLANRLNIPVKLGDVVKLTSDPMEKNEFDISLDFLQRCMADKRANNVTGNEKRRIESSSFKAFQHQMLLENHAAFFDPGELLRQLVSSVPDKNKITVSSIDSVQQGNDNTVSIKWAGDCLEAQMVLLGDPQIASQQVDGASESIVAHKDQFFKFAISKGQWLSKSAQLISHKHGYYYLGAAGEEMFAGGARFLEKDAGIGNWGSEYKQSIEDHLKNFLAKQFEIDIVVDESNRWVVTDILGCDEFPLLGPMPGRERILIGTGFAKNCPSWEGYAAIAMADFILMGSSNIVPKRFLPSRLRSLT